MTNRVLGRESLLDGFALNVPKYAHVLAIGNKNLPNSSNQSKQHGLDTLAESMGLSAMLTTAPGCSLRPLWTTEVTLTTYRDETMFHMMSRAQRDMLSMWTGYTLPRSVPT